LENEEWINENFTHFTIPTNYEWVETEQDRIIDEIGMFTGLSLSDWEAWFLDNENRIIEHFGEVVYFKADTHGNRLYSDDIASGYFEFKGVITGTVSLYNQPPHRLRLQIIFEDSR
jgi:hypothetical protein